MRPARPGLTTAAAAGPRRTRLAAQGRGRGTRRTLAPRTTAGARVAAMRTAVGTAGAGRNAGRSPQRGERSERGAGVAASTLASERRDGCRERGSTRRRHDGEGGVVA